MQKRMCIYHNRMIRKTFKCNTNYICIFIYVGRSNMIMWVGVILSFSYVTQVFLYVLLRKINDSDFQFSQLLVND